MRLINTKTQSFEEFLGEDIPAYAILSHTWEPKEEVSYKSRRLRVTIAIIICTCARQLPMVPARVDIARAHRTAARLILRSKLEDSGISR